MRKLTRTIVFVIGSLSFVGAGLVSWGVSPAGAAQVSPAIRLQPHTAIYQPINTIFYVTFGDCTGTAEYGNYLGAAYAKIMETQSGCEGSVDVLGDKSGTLTDGGYAFATTLGTWAQSTVYSASVVSGSFSQCDTQGLCEIPVVYTPFS
jgi:hypothetical protein